MTMRAAYVLGSCFFGTVMISGGATLSYLDGDPWWFVVGFVLCLMQGASLSKRLDQWSKSE